MRTPPNRGMPVLLMAAMLAAPCWAASAGAVLLAEGGHSEYSIVIPADAAEAEAFAARELRRYMGAVSGAALEIQEDSATGEGPYISIGQTRLAQAAGILPAAQSPQDDQYRIAVQEGNVYIAGARPRGTLYGVYHLLERLGCRWFAPGFRFYKGMHERVPRIEAVQLPAELDIQEQPAFEYRQEFPEHYYLHEPDDMTALIDWCAKNRINTVCVRLNEFSAPWYRVLHPEIARRDLLLSAEGHAFDRFLPRSVYFHDHPEWYGPINGANSDRYFDQFNLSNPRSGG
jgi:hypothetical protein